MTLQKASATELRKYDINYSVFPTDVLSQIRNTDALAVWTYLLNKADGWIIRMQDIQNHFEIGRDKARNALKYLEDMDLVWRSQTKDDKGQIKDNIIVCSCLPRGIIEAIKNIKHSLVSRRTENPSVGKKNRVTENPSTGAENRPTEKPTVGKSVTLYKYRDLNKGSITTTTANSENAKIENQPTENPPELRKGIDYFNLHDLDEDTLPEWAEKSPKFYALKTRALEVWRGFVLHHKACSVDEVITIQKLSNIWDKWVRREKNYESRNQSATNQQRTRTDRDNSEQLPAIEQIRQAAAAAGRYF